MSVLIAVILIFVAPIILFCLSIIRNPNSVIGKAIHYFFVSYIVILLIVLVSSCIFSSIKNRLDNKRKNEQIEYDSYAQDEYAIAYASGYDDALHGVRPSVEDVKCYSCGVAYSDYADINFYEFSSVYVPICQNCVEKHDYTNPIVVFGEEYFFSPAKAQE